MSRWFPIVALAAVLASVGAGTARAGDDSPDELLGRYQPVLVLDRTERFAPTPVDAFIDSSDLEPYVLFKAIRGRYRVIQFPCTVVYHAHEGYTKMRGIRDWWRLFRPALLLRTGVKR